MRTLVVSSDAALAASLAAAAPGEVILAELAEGEGSAPEAYATALVAAVRDAAPDLVLGGASASDRVLLGAVAGALGATLLTRVIGVTAEGRITWRAHGGMLQVESMPDGLVVASVEVLEPSHAGEPRSNAAAWERLRIAASPGGPRVIAVDEAEAGRVDLDAARRVVGVGSGLRAASDLALIRELADALDAEIACTRPIAQQQGWLPTASYVGTSGRRIAPELYVAVGISGQLQHTLGVRGAGTIVVINSDPSAPFLAECDHAIVGDLYAVIPALVRALRG